ncbi:MAG: S26 family signal peptidase, partial [Clostridia bacterium]|nr:S26 family signal peptidase [Clostridia bacterium]
MLNKLKELFKSKKAQKDGEQKERQPIGALNIVGIVICVLLVPVLIVNCTLIIQSMIHEDEVPSFGKYIPLIVLTESMEPAIMSGDLIICQKADAEDLDVGDVISYFDPKSSASAVVT